MSGGEAGDGLDGEYKQDGTNVSIWVADKSIEGAYDGEKLE